MTPSLHKYPRTQHIEGSRLQPGDEDLDAVPFRYIAGHHLVVTEKMDGANCGISFSAGGELRLQSRGHFLVSGGRERHFSLLKQWATTHAAVLFESLTDRYVLYGEWLYAKHTVFYDALPHYLMAFDLLDVETGVFLDTTQRREILTETPVESVRVLHEGPLRNLKDLTDLLGPSRFIKPHHLERLRTECERLGLDADRVIRETDLSTDMEGLYMKVEEDGQVVARYKYVRAGFLQTALSSGEHWLNRPIVPNLLAEGVQLF